MRINLTLTCGRTVLGAILAAAQDSLVHSLTVDDDGDIGDLLVALTGSGNAPSTSTGTGTAAPTPIPSPPISVAPTPPAPTPPSGEDDEGGEASDGAGTDSTGLPWDNRIHSTPAAKNKDGSWRKRRGLDDATFATVSAELRAAGAGAPQPAPLPMPAPAIDGQTSVTAPPPPLPAPVIEAAPQPMPAPVPAPLPTPQPVAAPTPMPAVEPAPTPAMPATAAPASPQPAEQPQQEWDFATLMQAIGPKMGEGEGQINAAYLAAVCGIYGLNSITDLALQPEKIAQIVAQFQVDGRW